MKKHYLKLGIASGMLVMFNHYVNAQWSQTGNNSTTSPGHIIGFTDAGSTTPIDIQNGGTSRIFIKPTGEVGIGTNAPSYTLDIKNPANCNFRVQSQASGSANLILARSSNSTNCLVNYKTGTTALWYTGCSGNNDFSIKDATSTSVLTIATANNNIGIGTTAPVAKLHVFGTTELMVLGNDGGLNVAYDNTQIQARSGTNVSTLYENFYGGDVQLGGGVSGINPLIYKGTSGNVGIGTASPAVPFDVVNHSGFNVASFDGGNQMYIALKENGVYRGYIGSYYSGAAEDVDFGTGSSNTVGSLHLSIQASPKLSISSAGNVGIGTTTPNAKLDVAGTVRLNDNKIYLRGGTDQFHYLGWDLSVNGPALNGFSGGSLGGTNTATSKVLTWTWSGAYGKVGIGTSSPNYKLQVAGSIFSDSSLYVDGAGHNTGDATSSIQFGIPNSGEYINSKRNAGGNQNGLDFNTNFTPRISITNGGQVSMGTTASGSYRLTISGSGLASGGTWVNSDERYKKNITPIVNALANIMKLEGVTYNYKREEFPQWNFDATEQIGVIAQQVERVIPDLVKTDNDGYKAVSYEKFTPILIEAIKEQQSQILDLKTSNNSKDKIINQLNSRMDQFENALSQCCTSYQTDKNASMTQGENTPATLEQNAPNPFTERTTIKFYIPSQSQNAVIKIISIDGKEIQTIKINQHGAGQVTIEGNVLAAGTYSYQLIIDGKGIDNKLMTLTK